MIQGTFFPATIIIFAWKNFRAEGYSPGPPDFCFSPCLSGRGFWKQWPGI